MTSRARRTMIATLGAAGYLPAFAANAQTPAAGVNPALAICTAPHPVLERGLPVPGRLVASGSSAAAVFSLVAKQGEPVRIDAALDRVGGRSRLAIGICGRAGYREQRFTRFLAGDRMHAAIGFNAEFDGNYLVRVTSDTSTVAATLTATTVVPGPPATPVPVAVDDRDVAAALDASAPRRVLLGEPYRAFAVPLKKGRRYLVRYTPAKIEVDVGRPGGDFWTDNFEAVPDMAHPAGDGRSLLNPTADGTFLLVLHADDASAASPVALTVAVRELPVATIPVPVRVAPGSVINDKLDVDDATISRYGANEIVDDNRPYKLYRVDGRRGDSVTVCMTAKFPTVLEGGALLPLAVPFASIGFNDDAGTTAPNSRMQMVFADKGTIIVRAEAAEPGGFGPYELRVVRDTSGSVCPFDTKAKR